MTHELSLYYWLMGITFATFFHARYDAERFGKLTRKDKLKRILIRAIALTTCFAFLEWQTALGVIIVTHVYCWNIFDPIVAMFAGLKPNYVGETSGYDLIGRKIGPDKYMAIKFVLLILVSAFTPALIEWLR